MSVRLPAAALDAPEDSVSGSESSDDDQDFGDWISDDADKSSLQIPFRGQTLASAKDVLAYDASTHGFDLDAVCSRLALDVYQRIRLINYIRKEKPSPSSLELTGSEPFLTSDEYITPAIEDDPLLLQGDNWSDDEDTAAPVTNDPKGAERRIRLLERKLTQAKQDLADYREFVAERLDATRILEALSEPSDEPALKPRDDDTHYFDSYGENDIHAVMIQDRVRTSSYASFIMKNPALFRDAVVLDVGCGTGILSLFAARAGAKHVYAVDASPVAERAAQIVAANDLQDTITVIRGKIEEIALPVQHVDVIVSEWMGYALLYESMLDSVLVARDRFLRPRPPAPEVADPETVEDVDVGGVMAPSQCKMMLALCEGKEIYKERVDFWNDVYGFDLSAMAGPVYDDALVDIVPANSLLSEPVTIKDVQIASASARALDFAAPFVLSARADRRTKTRAFVLYFDTFFAPDGQPVAADERVQVVRQDEARLAEVWHVGGAKRRESRSSQNEGEGGIGRKPSLKKRANTGSGEAPLSPAMPRRSTSLGEGLGGTRVTSFSTGPQSEPTHWKQTIFLLREPFVVEDGSEVRGTFHCRKAPNNSRELEVEIHYAVTPPGGAPPAEAVVQMFKVR